MMNRFLAALLAILPCAVPASAVEIRNSVTPGAVPSGMTAGEIASNRADGLLFYQNAANTATLAAPLPSNTAATAYTPTVTAGSGSFGTGVSATGRWLTVGRLVYVYAKLTIPANGGGAGNGSAAGFIALSLPFPPVTDGGLVGQEVTATGVPVFGQILASTGLLYLKRMDGTTSGLFGGNVTATLTGVYERQ